MILSLLPYLTSCCCTPIYYCVAAVKFGRKKKSATNQQKIQPYFHNGWITDADIRKKKGKKRYYY